MKELKPKFMPHTADWALLVESKQWNMRGDWHGFHSVVQEYKLCLDPSLHPALIVNMIKALDPYLRRNVVKEPRSTEFGRPAAPPWGPDSWIAATQWLPAT